MLIDNIKILKNKYPNIYKMIANFDKEMYETILIEKAKDGNSTVKYIDNNKSIYIHSKYYPKKESETIVEDFFDLEVEAEHIIVYGVGLGYHILALAEKYPKAKFSLIEPSFEILHAFLCEINLKDIELENIYIDDANYVEKLVDNIVVNNKTDENKIFTLTSYKNIFENKYKMFLDDFMKLLKSKRSSISVNYNFQKRWVVNSLKNFSTTINTKNILLQDRSIYKNKAAVIVSAGPSLEDELENIRKIRDNNLAYIFSAGSSISTLIKNGIYPHATTSYDPGQFNYNVFNEIYRNDIKDIPLIYGTSVGFETIDKYPGEKLHMITSQDMISQFLIQSSSKNKIEGIIDSPSIAIINLQLLYRLGFSKIILVGQNFAYRDKKRYSSGIEYENELVDDEIIKKSMKVKSVTGDFVYTNYAFNQMREQMEQYIAVCKGATVINTTQGGAHIDGAQFMSLNDVINNYLTDENCVNNDWEHTKETDSYDLDYLDNNNKILVKSYYEIKDILKEISGLNDKIFSLAKNQNIKQLEFMYNKIDEIFSKLLNNLFYEIALKPMHRVEFELLGNEVNNIKKITNPLIKAERMVNEIGKFVYRCYEDYNSLSEYFNQMQEAIELKIKEKK